MFDLRANVITALAAASVNDVNANNDFKSTEQARADILGGRFPVTEAVLGVGDVRVIERKSWSWGKNLVRAEIDILMFTRLLNSTIEYGVDNELQTALTKNELSTDDVLTCELRSADSISKIHDNIWTRRWILEVLILEDNVLAL